MCIQFESAFFRLNVTSVPSPEPGIFGITPEFGQSHVSAPLIVLKPQFLSFVNSARRLYTVTVSRYPRTTGAYAGTTGAYTGTTGTYSCTGTTGTYIRIPEAYTGTTGAYTGVQG